MKKFIFLIMTISFIIGCTKDEPVNNPPQIQSINISPTKTTPGTNVQVNAVATDADGDPITYTWSSEIGTLSDMNSSSLIWEIPVSANTNEYYSIELIASDGKETVSRSQNIRIQEGITVTGSIFYKDTKVPVSGVNVSIGNISAISNDEGYYELINVAEGQQDIILSKNGFDNNMQTESISTSNKIFDFYMTSAEYSKNVYGYVQAGDEMKIRNVKVTLLNPDGEESNISTISDATGFYQLVSVPTGQRKLKLKNENNSVSIANYELEKEIYLATSDYNYNPRVYVKRTATLDILNSGSWDNISPDLYELQSNRLVLKPGCTFNISLPENMPNDFLPNSGYNDDGTLYFYLRGTNNPDYVGDIDFYADNESVFWSHSAGPNSGYRVYYIKGSNWEKYRGRQPKYKFYNDLSRNWYIEGADFSYYY